MSGEVPDPHEEFSDMDLDNIDVGFSEEDLEDVVESVKGDLFQCAGVQCRVRKKDIEERDATITKSRQLFWMAGIEFDRSEDIRRHVARMMDKDVEWSGDGYLEVLVGHHAVHSREDAEDEAEWLAEQLVMIKNDPNSPI